MEIKDSREFNQIFNDYNNIIIKNNRNLNLSQKIESLKDLQKKLTKIRIPNTNYRYDKFADLLENEIKLLNIQNKNKTGFGETIYNTSDLRPVTDFKMNILNSHYTINGRSGYFYFYPQYHMYGEIKYINRTFYEINLYNFALQYLINKYIRYKIMHLKKENKPINNNIPAFCEIFFSERNFIFDCNFDKHYPLLQKIMNNNQQVNPSCSLFGINISLKYIEKNVKIKNTDTIVKEFTAITGINYPKSFHYTRSLVILLYRKDNSVQLYGIDSNFDGNEEIKNVLENVLLVNLQNKLKTYCINSVQWVWEKPIFIGNNIHHLRSDQVLSEINYSSLVSILLIDIINRNFLIHDSINAIADPKEINFMTEYLVNVMISLERYFNNMKKEHYMIFLCNYARYVLQYILFSNNDESLGNFNVDEIKDDKKKNLKDILVKKPKKHPFIVKKLNDILNDEKYKSNTNNTILILKRFFVLENYKFRILGISFNNNSEANILNRKQKINNVKYFLIPFEMRTDLSHSINLNMIIMMSLTNGDFFRINQSDGNDSKFTITSKGTSNEIPKENITFVLLNYELLYSTIINVEDPLLYYAVRFQNKPADFITYDNRLSIQTQQNSNWNKIRFNYDKNSESKKKFKSENKTEGRKLLNKHSAEAEEKIENLNKRIGDLTEYIYDHEKSLEEYKECQEDKFKLAIKDVINAINRIQNLNEEYKKKIIYYMNYILKPTEHIEFTFINIDNAELEEIIRQYNTRVDVLTRRHINFEQDINSVKLNLEEELESAIQERNDHERTRKEKEEEIIYNMKNRIPVSKNIQPLYYSTRNKNAVDNNGIQFTDINSAQKSNDETKSEYINFKDHRRKDAYRYNSRNKNSAAITPDNNNETAYRNRKNSVDDNIIYESTDLKLFQKKPETQRYIHGVEETKGDDHEFENEHKDEHDYHNEEYKDESEISLQLRFGKTHHTKQIPTSYGRSGTCVNPTEKCAAPHKGLRNMINSCIGCSRDMPVKERKKRFRRGYYCIIEQYETWQRSIHEAEVLYLNNIVGPTLKVLMLDYFAELNLTGPMVSNEEWFDKMFASQSKRAHKCFDKLLNDVNFFKRSMEQCLLNLKDKLLPNIGSNDERAVALVVGKRIEMLYDKYSYMFETDIRVHVINYYNECLASFNGTVDVLRNNIPSMKNQLQFLPENECLGCMISSLQFQWHSLEWTWWAMYDCGLRNYGPMPIIENNTIIDRDLWEEGSKIRDKKCLTKLKHCTPVYPHTFVDYTNTPDLQPTSKDIHQPFQQSTGREGTEVMIPYRLGEADYYLKQYFD